MTRELNRKLLRDFRRYWPQFIAVLLMSMLSVLIYTGLEGAWNGLQSKLDGYAADTHLADVWIQTTGTARESIAALRENAVVDEAAGVTLNNATDLNGGVLEVEVLTAEQQALSLPTIVDGEAMSLTGDGIWLGQPYAEAYGYSVGDTISVRASGTAVDLTVRGLYYSPEKLYYTGSPSLVAPDPALYGYASASASALMLDEDAPMANLIRVSSGEPEQAQTVAFDLLGDSVVRTTDRDSNMSVSTAFDRVTQIRNLSVLFSSIFVLLAILAMYTSTRRLVDMQDREIATMKALGIPRKVIGVHYAMYGLVAGGVGGVLGIAIAPVMSSYVLATQKTMLSVPSWGIAYTMLPIGVLVLVLAACVGGAYFAARPAMQAIPAEQLRPGVARGRHIALERIVGLWRRTSFGSRWAWRDSGNNKTRFVMGVIAVGGSVMLLFAGFGMADSMHGQVVSAFVDENDYYARVTLSGSQRLGGGLGESPQELEELTVRTSPEDGFDRVLTVVGSGDYIHLTTTSGIDADPSLVSITEATASRLGVEIGDDVEITQPAAGVSLTLPVEQVVKGSAPQGFYLSEERWQGLGQDFVATTVLVDDSAELDVLRDSSAVASVILLSQQYDNAEKMVNDLGGIFMLIRVFAVLLTVIVLYSLGSLAFTERVRDYATLKVLGLGLGDLRRLASRENIVATVLGLGVGIPAGKVFLGLYVGTFSTARLEYTAQIGAVSACLACAIAAAFSLATTFLLGRRVRRIDCASALKGVE